MAHKLTIISLIFFLFCALGFAQDKRIIVNLDIDTGDFKSEDRAKIPFDQSFYIHGITKNKNLKKVIARYKVDNYNCKKHYFINPAPANPNDYVIIEVKEIKNGEFTILVPKLHPNENYKFAFDFQEKLELSEAKNDQLRLNILTAIDYTFGFDRSKITHGDITILRNKISTDIRKFTGNKILYDRSNNRINNSNDLSVLLTKDPELSSSFDKIVDINTAMYSENEKLIYMDFVNNSPEIIHKILLEFKNKKGIITTAIETVLTEPDFKDLIKQPVNSSIKEYSNVSLKTVLEFIRNDYNRSTLNLTKNPSRFPGSLITDLRSINGYFFSILTGNAKLKGIIVEPVTKYDKPSIELILSAFIQLKNLKKTNDTSYVLLPNNSLDGLNNYLLQWVQKVSSIQQDQLRIDEEKENNTRILKDVYSRFSVKADADTSVDIETSESPYLGLDFGVLTAPEISSTFTFEGLNFHLRPVNRKAKFSDLKGLDLWLKRISFSFGVAQRIGSYNDNYKNLVGVGSPFVGVGIRLNRMIRINGGVLFYKTENSNPIITNTDVNATYFLSASIDIKLKDALNIIGNFN